MTKKKTEPRYYVTMTVPIPDPVSNPKRYPIKRMKGSKGKRRVWRIA